MNRLFVTSLLFIFFARVADVAAGPPNVVWTSEKGRWVAEVKYDVRGGAPSSLTVQSFTGNVTVSGSGTKAGQVTIRCVIDRGLSRDDAEQVLKKVLPGVEIVDGNVQVRGSKRFAWSAPDAEVSLDAILPVATDLQLNVSAGDVRIGSVKGNIDCSVSGGSLRLAQVQGDVSAAVSGGDLVFEQVSGELTAATSGGNIKLADYSGTADVTTAGGEITIRKVDGALSATTMGGDIHAQQVKGGNIALTSKGGDLIAEDISAEHSAELVTAGGDIDASNTSGPMDFVASGGDIEVRKHQGDVEIRSSSGDVVLRDLLGSVTANVGSGDVEVWLAPGVDSGGRVELSTGTGSLDLHLPARLGAVIEASVGTAGRDRSRLKSDFPLEYEHTSSGNLRASGTINGGGIPILLTAGSGHIRILSQ